VKINMAENNDFLEDFYDTDELKNSISNSLSRYSQSTRICQYVPTDHKPSYSEMVDETKYRQLMDDIEKRAIEVDGASVGRVTLEGWLESHIDPAQRR
jgi:hypothetical protein